MSWLTEIERIGEAVCLREERNFTIPEVIATGFYCDNAEDDSIEVQVLACIMFISLMAVAVVGNCVVMWIIYKHKVMHYGFNYFLFNMAFADLLIAVFNVGTSWTFNLYHDWWYGDICILTSFFGIAPTTVSVFSMMALSWDRCKAVVWPLKKRPLSQRCSLFTIAVIWAMSTATALPFTFAAMYALPLFVLSLTFALIAWAFRSTDVAADHNSKRSSHTKAKNKAVKMLGLMVITFMFCWLPYHLYHTFGLNSFMEFKDPNTGKYIYLGIYWVAMSSSAYNPIIYCFSNERFRIGFRYVFRWLPMIECRHEDYVCSQLFPEKLRSMAISKQVGLKNPKKFPRTYDSIGLPLACNDSGDRWRIRSSCSTSRTPLAVEADI